MLEAARARRFQVVLCKTQSRFTRDMELVEKYLHGLFPLWGIRFVAVVDHVDTAVRGGKKARQINGLVNEWYLEDLSENIRAVFDSKRRAGQFIGSFSAYGYRKDPEDHSRLLLDPIPAEVVRTIFRLCLEGWGRQAIAARLNREGVLNPTAYKQAQGLRYRNGTSALGLWNKTTVGRILRSETYTGAMVQGTRRKPSYKAKQCVPVPEEEWFRVAGTHEAIVDRETFDAVQRLLDSRARSDGTGEVHLLAGKVRCGDCGGPMVKVSQTYKGTRRSYLQCALYAATRHEPRCTRHSIRLDALTERVVDRLREEVKEHYVLTEPARFLPAGGLHTPEKTLREEAKALTREVDRRTAALGCLYLDRASGLLTPGQFQELNRRLTEERDALGRRLTAVGERIKMVEIPDLDLSPELLVREALRLDPMPRTLVELLLKAVLVGERREDGSQEIELIWNL